MELDVTGAVVVDVVVVVPVVNNRRPACNIAFISAIDLRGDSPNAYSAFVCGVI